MKYCLAARRENKADAKLSFVSKISFIDVRSKSRRRARNKSEPQNVTANIVIHFSGNVGLPTERALPKTTVK